MQFLAKRRTQNGHKLTFRNGEKKTCSVCGQIVVLHGTMPRLFRDAFRANQLIQKGEMFYDSCKTHEMACYGEKGKFVKLHNKSSKQDAVTGAPS